MDVMEMGVKKGKKKREKRKKGEEKKEEEEEEKRGHGEISIKGREFVNRPSDAVCLHAFGCCSPFSFLWEVVVVRFSLQIPFFFACPPILLCPFFPFSTGNSAGERKFGDNIGANLPPSDWTNQVLRWGTFLPVDTQKPTKGGQRRPATAVFQRPAALRASWDERMGRRCYFAVTPLSRC